MSAGRKREAVLRLLRGEDLELVSRELGVTAAELSGWRDQFLAAGEASLKSRPADARDAEIGWPLAGHAPLGGLTGDPLSPPPPHPGGWGQAPRPPPGPGGGGPGGGQAAASG